MRRQLTFLRPAVSNKGTVEYEVAQKQVEVQDDHDLEVKLRETCFTTPLEHNGKLYWRKPIDTEDPVAT